MRSFYNINELVSYHSTNRSLPGPFLTSIKQMLVSILFIESKKAGKVSANCCLYFKNALLYAKYAIESSGKYLNIKGRKLCLGSLLNKTGLKSSLYTFPSRYKSNFSNKSFYRKSINSQDNLSGRQPENTIIFYFNR